jgi:hypothetical protein
MAPEKPLSKDEALFLQLVISFQTAAYHQMGKIASPLTGKVERNLDQAENSIDMLGMIQEKTKGNLTESERKIIENVLYELRMNYLEELKKDQEKPKEATPRPEERPKREKSEEDPPEPSAKQEEEKEE